MWSDFDSSNHHDPRSYTTLQTFELLEKLEFCWVVLHSISPFAKSLGFFHLIELKLFCPIQNHFCHFRFRDRQPVWLVFIQRVKVRIWLNLTYCTNCKNLPSLRIIQRLWCPYKLHTNKAPLWSLDEPGCGFESLRQLNCPVNYFLKMITLRYFVLTYNCLQERCLFVKSSLSLQQWTSQWDHCLPSCHIVQQATA